jgi:hypothetical protein
LAPLTRLKQRRRGARAGGAVRGRGSWGRVRARRRRRRRSRSRELGEDFGGRVRWGFGEKKGRVGEKMDVKEMAA